MKYILFGILAATLSVARPSYALETKNCAQLLVFDYEASEHQDLSSQYEALIQRLTSHKTALMNSRAFSFGYESEFTLDQYSNRILQYYGPATIDSETWSKMGSRPDVQLTWVKENLKKLFPVARQAGELKLLANGAALGYLPKSLILDYTGNLELVMAPVSPFREWKRITAEIADLMGNGSLQSTVGIPWEKFWQTPGNTPRAIVGMTQFFADLDALLKLNSGYLKARENRQKPAASAFAHPYLGPLTALRRRALETFTEANFRGEKLDAESLEFISHSDDSWKFIGSTVYRPDIAAPKFMVFEVRDTHSNLALLEAQILRLLYFLDQGLVKFETFASVKAFDTEADFNKLPVSVATMLSTLFPKRFMNPDETYSDDEVLANETYRAFAFPMRNWNGWLGKLKGKSIASRIGQAQLIYSLELAGIEKRWRRGELDDVTARLEIQFSLSKFSGGSGLLRLFLDKLEELSRDVAVTPSAGKLAS